MYQDWDKDQIYIFLITNYHIIPPQPQRNRGEHWYQNPERECVEEAALRGAAVLVKKHRQPKAGPRSRYPGLPQSVCLPLPETQVLSGRQTGSGRCPGGGNGSRSRFLPWEIPWTEEPGGLQSMRLQRVRHEWVAEPKALIPPSRVPPGLPVNPDELEAKTSPRLVVCPQSTASQ